MNLEFDFLHGFIPNQLDKVGNVNSIKLKLSQINAHKRQFVKV